LLVKKDRGRPINPTARPKAFGETTIATDVPGAELLAEDISLEGSDDESDAFDSDDEEVLPCTNDIQQSLKVSSNKLETHEDHKGEEEVSGEQDDTEEVDEDDSDDNMDDIEDDSDMDGGTDVSDEDDDEELNDDSENEDSDQAEDSDEEDKSKSSSSKVQKRKLSDYIGQLDAADASLRTLKRLAGAKKAETSMDSTDEAGRIFSDEDFKLIRERKVYKFQIIQTFNFLLRPTKDVLTIPKFRCM
jgi:protein SDA1